MSDINNQICDAIGIIVDKKLSQANFDKTIQATIVAQGDKTKGEYKVKYLDSLFYAYDKSGKDYAVGTQVYILVPENDLSKVKTILGTADKTKDTQPIIVPEGNKFEYLTDNLFIINSENKEFGIKSWENKNDPDISIYNNFTIDTDGLSYITKEGFDYFILKCNVRTNLQKSQQSSGTYGIRIAISADLKKNQQNNETENTDSTNNNTENQETQNLELEFELDSTMMVGNPYSLVIPVEQIAGFNVANYTNIDIKDVSLFSYKFDPLNDGEEDKENNIFFTDLSLQCANKISVDNLNGNYLYVSVPNGQYLSTKDRKDSVVLKAIFQSKGQIIDPTKYSGLTYYWFKRNPLISVTDKEKGKYCKINGINTEGWECLNTYDEKSNTFKAGGDTYTIDQNSFLSSQQEYRCIALFDNLAYSKTKMVYNKNPQYIISLISDSGPIFYNNNGKPTLICRCRKAGDNSDEAAISADYYWYATKIDSQRKRINEEWNKQISKQSISINEYPDKAIIDCAVVKSDDKIFIGVETLELLNLKSDTTTLYNLTIENGYQMFKYNTLGISPIHASSTNSSVEPSEKEKEVVLQPLSFTLVNNKTGEEFTEGSSQKWILPPDSKTMLDFSNVGDIQDYNEEGYKVYEGTTLDFSIKSEYDYTKTNNTISLEVIKENQTYYAEANILFTKEGDNGTNGTDYSCQIVGIQGGQKISFNNGIPYYYYNKSDGDKFYYNQDAISNQLKLKVLKNTQEIEIDNSQITWSVLKSPFFRNGNNYTSTKDYPFILTVDNSGTIREDENYKSLSNIEDIANIIIIKAECSFEDANNHKLIYATQPIGIVLNNPDIYNNYVENGSGFYRVVYDADGTNPSYANTDTNIFRILGPEKGYFYKWKIIGEQLYFQDAKETNKKEIKVIAKDPLLAENISNGITCEIYLIKDTDIITEKNGEVFINGESSSPTHQIIIPIHLSTNRFGHSAINGWDGNTVSIDQEGGVVLLPQIGAGRKDENNAFTGILMGTSLLKDHDDSTTNEDSYLKESGLMGFYKGERSFFLKADDGSATFGKSGFGQIKILPVDENGKPQAIITGGLYPKDNDGNPSGMEINLSAPSITYGSKKFSVNKDGILTCTDANINGWFSAKSSYNEEGYNNSYNINFSKDKSEITMSQTKNNNTNVTIIKPGYFKTGSDKENEDNASYLKYNNGKMQLKGDFDCIFKDKNSDKGRVQFNSNIGIRMEHKTNISSDGEYKAFTLTQNSLAFGSYKRTFNPDSNSTIETINGSDYELTSGLSYNYANGLSIKGKITATSGVIGGWRINENYIASANDGLILYSDGRIQGKMNVNSSGSNERSLNEGLLVQTDEKGKAEFTPYGLATFKILPNEQTYTRQYDPQFKQWSWSENYNSLSEEKKAALQLKRRFSPHQDVWVEVYSLIEYKNQSTIGVNYNDNSIGIVSKEEKTPISFVLKGDTTLASSTMTFSRPKQDSKETKVSTFSTKAASSTTSQNKKSNPQYAELSFPYKETIDGKQQNYDGTRISAVKIVTGDVEIDKDAKVQMKTRSANSLVSAVNEILTPPNKVVYKDGTPSSGDSTITIDTLTEYWYNPNFQYNYNIKIKNKNSSDEQVLSLERKPIMDGDKIIHPGYVINLEGF